MNTDEKYIAVETSEGWIIRRLWRTHVLVPVGCSVGGLQYGADDAAGAFCTLPHTRDDQLYEYHSHDLLGLYPTRALAEKMIGHLEGKG